MTLDIPVFAELRVSAPCRPPVRKNPPCKHLPCKHLPCKDFGRHQFIKVKDFTKWILVKKEDGTPVRKTLYMAKKICQLCGYAKNEHRKKIRGG